MCDYSLDALASRPAKVGDRLISTGFSDAITRGFASADDRNVAVCLLPGTEVAFDDDVSYDRFVPFLFRRRIPHKVARFREVNVDYPAAHHDALEFPDGKVVLVNALREGQRLTVLQLSALARLEAEIDAHTIVPVMEIERSRRRRPALVR